jgi:tetratricopeptide (TPR) repeat protein
MTTMKRTKPPRAKAPAPVAVNGHPAPVAAARPAVLDPVEEIVARLKAGDRAGAEVIFDQAFRAGRRDIGFVRLGKRLKLELGRYADAEQLSAALVAADPTAAADHNDLGVARAALGRPEEAIPSFAAAVRLKPTFVEPWNNWALSLRRLKRTDEAVGVISAALALNPSFAEGFVTKGILHRDKRAHPAAVEALSAALALKPDHGKAARLLGFSCIVLERFADAIKPLEIALAADPNDIEVRFQLGRSHHELGDADTAAPIYRAVLARKPDHVGALNNLGVALAKIGRDEEAKARDRRGARPADDEAAEANRLDEAIAIYRAAVNAKPEFASGWSNLASALFTRGDWREAVAAYETALKLSPDEADAHANLGSVLQWIGRLNEAERLFERALVLRPDFPSGEFNLATLTLLKGDWARGWDLYHSRVRWKPDKYGRTDLKLWDGLSTDTLTDPKAPLVIATEQGLGDTLQFIRFVAPFAARFKRPYVIQCDRRLVALLRRAYPRETFVTIGDAMPAGATHWLPLMSIPRVLSTRVDNIPAAPSYLSADPARVDRFAKMIGPQGFKIAFVWQGNPKRHVDLGRSYALEDLAGIAALPGVRLLSVQKGVGSGQLERCSFRDRIETFGPEFDEGPDAFEDTAAVMMNADLVITPDTSIAHLAGALGVKTFLALKHIPDWRWLLNRADTPFYPSIRLYRQAAVNDWAEVFRRMTQDVKALAVKGR